MNYSIIPFSTHYAGKVELGNLSVFDENDVRFKIRRVYYIWGSSKDVIRGGHAHRLLKQMLVCVYGSVEVVLDDGVSKENIILDNPSKGLLLEPGLWRDIGWKEEDSVLMVAASDLYDEEDYIRDYASFLKYKREGIS